MLRSNWQNFEVLLISNPSASCHHWPDPELYGWGSPPTTQKKRTSQKVQCQRLSENKLTVKLLYFLKYLYPSNWFCEVAVDRLWQMCICLGNKGWARGTHMLFHLIPISHPKSVRNSLIFSPPFSLYCVDSYLLLSSFMANCDALHGKICQDLSIVSDHKDDRTTRLTCHVSSKQQQQNFAFLQSNGW